MSCVVPILSTDLHEYESIEKMIEALGSLEKTFIAITTNIDEMIQTCFTRVNGLAHRITGCKQKISQLEGTNNAITIYSAPRYPKVDKINISFLPRISRIKRPQVKVHEPDHPGKIPKVTHEDINDLNKLLTELKVPTSNPLDQIRNHSESGLGKPPKNITQADSYVLFNSTQNPYRVEVIELVNERGPDIMNARNSVVIPDAPLTLNGADDFKAEPKGEFAFRPEHKQGPAMNMPSKLDIPGIATLDWGDEEENEDFGDSYFGFSKNPSFAKPAATSTQTPTPTSTTQPSISSTAPQAPPLPSSNAPPAPALPISKAPQAPPLPSNTIAPPPPPLPSNSIAPGPPPLPAVSIHAANKPPVESAPPADDNKINALLADIRCENPMARLRKTKQAENTKSASNAGPKSEPASSNPVISR
jgi:hypothetical protein